MRSTSVALLVLAAAALAGQDLLKDLGRPQDYRSRRVSSYDRSGGNRDSIVIEPGKTAVLAEIDGPGAIHHIWTTIAAEPFYGRKIVLRLYWDNERSPSVEAPIGDFFGVGHGLNRNFVSLPIACSSEGRARNCYWYMPFRRSCRVTATNEGTRAVDAFYYYIDYREVGDLPEDTPYFHAQYRQDFPPDEDRNYLLLAAEGSGHYVGCNLSVLQRAMGWWGEGDDVIKVDGETRPSLHGTGSEDYFSDAWGMREGQSLFYGCPLQEEDFQAGSKATVYRFHIPDPVPFKRSIQVTIEHGHGNDRKDFLSCVAYWYQTEPHRTFPRLAPVKERLPFAFEPPENFVLPKWEEAVPGVPGEFIDRAAGLRMTAQACRSPVFLLQRSGDPLSPPPDRRRRRRGQGRVPLPCRDPRPLHARTPFPQDPRRGKFPHPGQPRRRRGCRARSPRSVRWLHRGHDARVRRPRRASPRTRRERPDPRSDGEGRPERRLRYLPRRLWTQARGPSVRP
jgi:hypothetical protein